MPPAINFNQDTILDEAFRIVRNEGFQALTARKIAQNLGSSTQPVYSAFGSMRKLQEVVLQKAKAYIDVRSLNRVFKPIIFISSPTFRLECPSQTSWEP